jgi:hypothetical protein
VSESIHNVSDELVPTYPPPKKTERGGERERARERDKKRVEGGRKLTKLMLFLTANFICNLLINGEIN